MGINLIKKDPPYTAQYVKELNTLHKYFIVWIASYHRNSYFPALFCQFQKSPGKLDIMEINEEFRIRKKKILAVISNCDKSHSLRLEYINDLKNYFPLALYGGCFDQKISVEEYLIYFRKYMFYMAFENMICPDYITEKYCNPIIHGAIPIVTQPDINTMNLIPGSYINAFDFKSPKDLAGYLDKVSKDFNLYMKYFEWKKDYQITKGNITVDVCGVLNKILEVNETKKVHNDPVYSIFDDVKRCLTIDDLRKLLYKN